jgi:hypothetical protein
LPAHYLLDISTNSILQHRSDEAVHVAPLHAQSLSVKMRKLSQVNESSMAQSELDLLDKRFERM